MNKANNEMSDSLKEYIAKIDKEIELCYDEMSKMKFSKKVYFKLLFLRYTLFPLVYPYLWQANDGSIETLKKEFLQQDIDYHKYRCIIEKIKVCEKTKKYTLMNFGYEV